ncbi:MAG: UpxY family transcription antiterminator [Chitinophagaceae bacterium]
MRQWLAVYTKPRWEKKIYQLLVERGIECYCPLNKVHRQWSDRIKLVEEPLFKSYVFVRVTEQEQQQVKMVSGVLNFVYWLGKPAVLKQAEIDRIKRFLNEYDNVEIQPILLKPSDKVVVTGGALMEQQGRVLRTIGNKAEIEIESLGYRLVAQVSKKNLAIRK